MNITPQTPSLSIATVVNPATETLRRDNNQRDIIVKPEAASQSAAEKGLGSEKDRNKTATLNNEQIDFESLRKRAEQESRVIGDGSEKGSEQSSQVLLKKLKKRHQKLPAKRSKLTTAS